MSLLFVAGIGFSFSSDFPYAEQTRMAALIVGAMLASALLLHSAVKAVSTFRSDRLGGIKSASVEPLNYQEIKNLWLSAESEILIFGMGMSKLSRNRDLIRKTASRGVRVRIAMLDPSWLQLPDNAALVRALEEFYDTSNLVGRAQDSLGRIEAIARECCSLFGRDAVSVELYRNVLMMSATVVDPATTESDGIVEFHLLKGGDKRVRLSLKATNSPSGADGILEEISGCFSALKPEGDRAK